MKALDNFNNAPLYDIEEVNKIKLDLWNALPEDGEGGFLVDLHWTPESGGYVYHNRQRYEITGYENFSKTITVVKKGQWA